MAGLTEIPTDDLLSFQDYPTVHSQNVSTNPAINVNTAVDVGLPQYEKSTAENPISADSIDPGKQMILKTHL